LVSLPVETATKWKKTLDGLGGKGDAVAAVVVLTGSARPETTLLSAGPVGDLASVVVEVW
jgi:hypothetical protein